MARANHHSNRINLLAHGSSKMARVCIKPPSGHNFLMFFALSHNKWSKIGTEAKFGGSVASTIWSEQSAIETTTCIAFFIVKSVFLGSTAATCENMLRRVWTNSHKFGQQELCNILQELSSNAFKRHRYSKRRCQAIPGGPIGVAQYNIVVCRNCTATPCNTEL